MKEIKTKEDLEKSLTKRILHYFNDSLLKDGVLLKSDYEKIKEKIDEIY